MKSLLSDRAVAAIAISAVDSRLEAKRNVERQYDIDAVRGLAIILVVLGHVVARDMPNDNEWYLVLKELIYRFHMPLFMALSGMTFALSLPVFRDWSAIVHYSRGKVGRLFVPYLFFGLLILAGKLVAEGFIHVDNAPRGTLDDVLKLVIQPNRSAAGFLWFIYVLSLYYAVLPAFLQLVQRRPVTLFLVSLACRVIPWPSAFLLSEAFAYLPYFSGGMCLWLFRKHWSPLGIHSTTAWVALFCIAIVLAIPLDLSKWLIGALAVPAFLGLAQHIPEGAQRTLGWIGGFSLSIYLMNTVVMGLAKGLMLKVMPWDGMNFLMYFPVLATTGVFLPIAIKKVVARHFRRIDRYV